MNLFLRLALIAGLALPAGLAAQTAAKPNPAAGMNLKVRIQGLPKDSNVLLANYYGDKQFIQDTVKADANGTVVFTSDEPMPRGIYMVVLPGKKYFEIVLTDVQRFSLDTKTDDLIANMKVTGSEENKHFYDYLQYIGNVQKSMEPLRERRTALQAAGAAKKDSVDIINKKLEKLEAETKQFRLDYMKNHPKDFMTKVLNAMKEPEIPEVPAEFAKNDSLKQVFRFRYYKSHFFDGMDWTEDGLVRSPVYHNKITQYVEKLTVQHPDSIAEACVHVIEKTRPSKELFKYTTHHFTFKYETIKIMCFDAIFVHLVDKYYKTGQATWLSKENETKIIKRADQLRYTLCGKNPANMVLNDTAGKPVELQRIKAKYTLIAFWDPDCSHCQKEMPLLKTEYEKMKAEGIDVQVFAVVTEDDEKAWKKYVKDNKLPWINGRPKDVQDRALYKHYYDIYSTPVLFLIDEKKQIIAKRLDPEQMSDLIRRKEGKKVEPRPEKKTQENKSH